MGHVPVGCNGARLLGPPEGGCELERVVGAPVGERPRALIDRRMQRVAAVGLVGSIALAVGLGRVGVLVGVFTPPIAALLAGGGETAKGATQRIAVASDALALVGELRREGCGSWGAVGRGAAAGVRREGGRAAVRGPEDERQGRLPR